VQSSLLPTDATLLRQAMEFNVPNSRSVPEGWPPELPLQGLSVYIAVEGAGKASCTPFSVGKTSGVPASAYPSEYLLSGTLLFGNTSIYSTEFTVSSQAADTTTALTAIRCPNCLFGPSSAVEFWLPFGCQNVLLGVAVTDVDGGTQLLAMHAVAEVGAPLLQITWIVTPVLQLLQDGISGTQLRGVEGFLGPSSLSYGVSSTSTLCCYPTAPLCMFRSRLRRISFTVYEPSLSDRRLSSSSQRFLASRDCLGDSLLLSSLQNVPVVEALRQRRLL